MNLYDDYASSSQTVKRTYANGTVVEETISQSSTSSFRDASEVSYDFTSNDARVDALNRSIADAGGLNPITAAEQEEQAATAAGSGTDTRVRLRALRGQAEQVYGPNSPDNILSPMHVSDGLLFPYTPTISVTQGTSYDGGNQLVHTNGSFETYTGTPSTTISISGKFSIQNQAEGRYALAVLHLLRTISKMHFGQSDPRAGLPPPMMMFSGYGNYVFNDLPVIVKSHSYTLDESADTVTINTAGGIARLPSLFSISLELQVQQTPMRMRTEFNLEAFRTGALMRNSNPTGWI